MRGGDAWWSLPAAGLAIALMALAAGASGAPADMLDRPDTLRWERRLVFVFAADPAAAEAARSRLTGAAAEVEDRDITWFVVRDGETTSNHAGPLSPGLAQELERRFRRAGEAQALEVVLVGKDGGVKYRAATLDLAAVFAEIDRMPMRRQEMRDPNRGS